MKQENYVRTLVVSHNAFGKENNMAKTLEAEFKDWPTDKIAQLFFSEEIPESENCRRFFRISDSMVLRSLISRRAAGRPVGNGCRGGDAAPGHKPGGRLRLRIVKWARYRTPLAYISRGILWKLGKWRSAELDKWLDDFQPEAVFFASGDYEFSYKVALYIASSRNIPLIMGCYDDFYIRKKTSKNPLYRLYRRSFMKTAGEAFEYACSFTGICDKMTEAYGELWGLKGSTIYTPYTPAPPRARDREKRVIYAGNIDCGRAEQLVMLGRSIKNAGIDGIDRIEVYSGEIRTELTDKLSEENGLIFKGRVPPEKVMELINTSSFVVHAESFDEGYAERVRYSVSTKIADYLNCGACIIACGPKDIASIEYLADTNSAFVITESAPQEEKLRELFSDEKLQRRITDNAQRLAAANHDGSKSRALLAQLIYDAAAGSGKEA